MKGMPKANSDSPALGSKTSYGPPPTRCATTMDAAEYISGEMNRERAPHDRGKSVNARPTALGMSSFKRQTHGEEGIYRKALKINRLLI